MSLRFMLCFPKLCLLLTQDNSLILLTRKGSKLLIPKRVMSFIERNTEIMEQ